MAFISPKNVVAYLVTLSISLPITHVAKSLIRNEVVHKIKQELGKRGNIGPIAHPHT